jgi:hypothetical protein
MRFAAPSMDGVVRSERALGANQKHGKQYQA